MEIDDESLSVLALPKSSKTLRFAPLRVIAAACKVGDLVVSLPPPHRHHHILHALHAIKEGLGMVQPKDQAFLLSDGRFVDRKEAAQVALAAGQVQKLHAPPRLFSEDVW